MKVHLEPAARVVQICGGIEETARLIGRDRSVVNRWLLAKSAGGTAGRVPMHHATALLQKVPDLCEADFFLRQEAAE